MQLYATAHKHCGTYTRYVESGESRGNKECDRRQETRDSLIMISHALPHRVIRCLGECQLVGSRRIFACEPDHSGFMFSFPDQTFPGRVIDESRDDDEIDRALSE